MSEQLQLRRGVATAIASATGAQGEVFMDTTNNRLVLQDGATAGGIPIAKLSEVQTTRRTPIADANYTATASDQLVAYTSITAPRTVTLPAASAYPIGQLLRVVDESGGCSATVTLTIARAGTDTIDGATSAVVAAAYGFVWLESDGVSKWTVVGAQGGGPFVVSAASINANSVADTAIAVPLPRGVTKYRVARVTALNPSIGLTAAFAALYTGPTGGGVTICAPQALSGLTTNSANAAGNAIDLAQALAAATFLTAATLYFRITTAQGAAATVDVAIEIQPYE